MNIKSFGISLAIVTTLSLGFTGCGEEEDKEPPIISNVLYVTESLDSDSNIASVQVTSTIEKENSTAIYDNGRSLNFNSGNAENGYVILSSGKHILKICATNGDGTVCSEEKTYFISENLAISSYANFPLEEASNGITNNGTDLIYGTIDGKIYKLELNSKSSTQIANVNERVGGLAFVDIGVYYYSSALGSKKIRKLTISSNNLEDVAETSFPDGLDFYQDRIYAVTNNRSGILTIFNTNGIKYDTLNTGIDDIVGISHTVKYLYILSESGSIYQTNPKTGNSNKIFTNENLFDQDSGYNGLEAITIMNNYIYVSYVNNNSIYKINLDLSEYE